MRDFISIDFETANPQRVSACAFGYACVKDGQVAECHSYLIKPVGGHADFQSKIHGIKDEHTRDKPDFGDLYPQIATLFDSQLVAHSLFDQQVLRALSGHFSIPINFRYFDTSSLAKQRLPQLRDHKLKTLANHFGIPKFAHHDAKADAIACAHVCLKLHEIDFREAAPSNAGADREFKGMIRGILADNEVNYKEAYELLYWLEDHSDVARRFTAVADTIRRVLADNLLDDAEAKMLADLLVVAEKELPD